MPVETKLTLDDAPVRGALERVRMSLPLGGDMKPAFVSIGRIVKSGTQLRFRKQQSPEGVPWKPSQRVLREGGQTLRLSGRLGRSISFFADHASVAIGTNVVYARRQQMGYPGGPGRGHSHTPAREYLGASQAEKQEIVDTLNGFIGGRWAGR